MKLPVFTVAMLLVVQSFCTTPCAHAQNVHQGTNDLVLKTAIGHPMQYYVSLPKGWTPAKKWRILVVLEAAEKEYKANAMRFVAARQDLPFIILAPFIVTNGNAGRRDPAIFPYTPATWDNIEKIGNCTFDTEGLEGVIGDVQKEYQGEEKVLMTGFEAGTHLLWSYIFTRPERLAAAIPVSGNYIGRCVEEALISKHPSRTNLPIHALYGANDTLWGRKGGNFAQWERAKQLALKSGYANISEEELPAIGHVPVPKEIISYFIKLMAKETK